MGIGNDQVPAIYAALGKVNKEIGSIEKSRKNKEQGYSFRGIDEVYEAIHPLFAENGVLMRVRTKERIETERTTKNGGHMLHTKELCEVDFVSTADGSVFTYGPIWAEGLDNSDKGSNKCLSAAQKYAVLQTFTIPTRDAVDADAETPEAGQRVVRDDNAPPEPEKPAAAIGAETAGKIYSAFGKLGVSAAQLERKLGGPVETASAKLLDPLGKWRDEISKNRDAIARIFGTTNQQEQGQ